MTGPPLRTDLVLALIVRRDPARTSPGPQPGHTSPPPPRAGPQLLQLRRTRPPAAGSWQPVMGRIEPGESALDAALREAREETGLDRTHALNLWRLPRPDVFTLDDAIVLSPAYAVEVGPDFTPTLNHEHDAARWVDARAAIDPASNLVVWPSHRASLADLLDLLAAGSITAPLLRTPLPDAAPAPAPPPATAG